MLEYKLNDTKYNTKYGNIKSLNKFEKLNLDDYDDKLKKIN